MNRLNDSGDYLPMQTLHVYVQCRCFSSCNSARSPSLTHSNLKIVLLCGLYNKSRSIHVAVRLRLRSVRIISAKHTVLAGRQGGRTINKSWYSCLSHNQRICGLMDVQTTTLINNLCLRRGGLIFRVSTKIKRNLASNSSGQCFHFPLGFSFFFNV